MQRPWMAREDFPFATHPVNLNQLVFIQQVSEKIAKTGKIDKVKE